MTAEKTQSNGLLHCEAISRIRTAGQKFDRAIASLSNEQGLDRLVPVQNAVTEFYLSLFEALELAAGKSEEVARKDSQSRVRDILRHAWPRRPVSVAEVRAIATTLAYNQSVRFSASGEQDSRMTAALRAAAIATDVASVDPEETVRKSLRRLRKKMRGERFVGIDWDTLIAFEVDAEELVFGGLPKGPGRPRNARG